MSQPNAEPKKPDAPAPPPIGGLDPTLQATGIFESAMISPGEGATDPTLQATMNFTPSSMEPGGEQTIEVTNLAFPRAHLGPEPGVTMEMGPSTIPPRRHRPRADSDTAPTLDGEARTNAFSMSSVDGSAEVVLNDLPYVKDYQLLAELGRGGMGVVYKARQQKLDRLVALKMVLAGAHASADQLARFLIEARAVAHLTHNNIVQIFDVGERDNLPFFSLEFIDGGSLQQTINGKPQAVRFAARIVKTLCEAMAFAHDQGIIHRDLKPANVLMTKAGEPKITDFGLAKRLEGDSQQTRDGAIMGTPSYMAPEQAWGRTQEIGPLADQHAIAAILYEMLTGRPPYQGANPLDTLDQVRNQEPVPPTRLQPKVPKDLETICLKGLQKDSRKRYATCREMAEDLGRFLEEKPILARPVSTPERAYRWCKRNPKLALAYGSVAGLVLAGLIGASAFAVVLSQKNGELVVANNTAVAAEKTAKANEKKAIEKEQETRRLALVAMDQSGTLVEAQRYVTVLANQRLRDIPQAFGVRLEMFDVAQKSMDRAENDMKRLSTLAATSKETDALTLRTRAGIHQNRGMIYAEMASKKDKVWPEFDEMKRLAEQHFAIAPDDLEAIKNMAASRLTLGEYSFALKGDVAAAEKYYLESIDFRRQWQKREPKDDIAKQALANSLGALARLYLLTGRPRMALPLYEQEVALRDSVGFDQFSSSEFQREYAGLHEKLGDLYVELQDFKKGLDEYNQSLELRKEFQEKNRNHPQAARDIALSLQKRGNFQEIVNKDFKSAREDYEGAETIFRELLKRDATGNVTRSDLSRALYFKGTACLALKDMQASDAAYAEALSLQRDLMSGAKPIDDTNRQDYINLMVRLARCGEYEEASKIAEQIVKNPPNNAYILFQAACGYALSAGAVERNNPDKQALAKTYREAAMSALRTALARGWHSVQDISGDPDLEPLRSDATYPALLDEFRKADDADKAKADKKG